MTTAISVYECKHAWDLFRQIPSVWGPPETPHNALASLWRGVSSDAYDLAPSAFRTKGRLIFEGKWTPIGSLHTNTEQLQAEVETVTTFLETADRAGLSLPEDSQTLRTQLRAQLEICKPSALPDLPRPVLWPPQEVLSLMALAQHHGIPTRLLDWTWNPRVAAYFACVGAIAAQGREKAQYEGSRMAVWCMPHDAFSIGVPEHGSSNGINPTMVLVSAPLAGNRNLAAQRGVFLTSHLSMSFVKQEADRRPFEQMMGSMKRHPMLTKLTLDVSHARDLLLLLRFHEVHGATVYPGYDGVAKSIAERAHLPTQEEWSESVSFKAAQASGEVGAPYVRLPKWKQIDASVKNPRLHSPEPNG